MELAKIIMQLVTSVTGVIIQAFEKKDAEKLKKVTDVLDDDDNVLKAKALAALKRQEFIDKLEALED